MAGSAQRRPQLGEVVDLAVEHGPDGVVLVGERLVGQRTEVDDAKPRVTQRALPEGPGAVGIGTAMAQASDHVDHADAAHERDAIRPDQSRDATHVRERGTSSRRAASACRTTWTQHRGKLNMELTADGGGDPSSRPFERPDGSLGQSP